MNSIDADNLRAESDDDEYAFTVGSGNTGGTINVLERFLCECLLILRQALM